MEPSHSQSSQIITLYKAPQKCKGQKLLQEGFQIVDFPYNPPYLDGNCYFAGPYDRSIAEEFNQPFVFLGNGDEYAIATGLKSINPKLVIPLDFPKAYDVADPYVAKNISLSELKHWELAPYNMRILIDQGISPAITSASMSAADFWKSIQKLLSIGTSPKDILAGLTTIPASFLGLDSLVGSLERGKLASFSV